MKEQIIQSRKIIKCWDIWMADIPKREGEQGSIYFGRRPVLITSNNQGNNSSSTLNVYSFTSKGNKRNLPVHVLVEGFGLSKQSSCQCEQMIPLLQSDLLWKMGEINDYSVRLQIGRAAAIQNPIFATAV